MKIHLFGNLADLKGSETLNVEDQHTSEDLIRLLENKLPELKHSEYRLAVNQEIVSGNRPLKPEDEIALLPPFSGG